GGGACDHQGGPLPGTHDYQNWVEAFARNHAIPIEWTESGVRKQDYLQLALRRLKNRNHYGVYFILKSMEQGLAFPKHDNAFLAVDDSQALQAAADRLTPERIRERLESWTLVLGPKFSRRERAALNLRRFYAVRQVEYCRNFVFKRDFPIHKIFERSCELGLWRLTAHKISDIFGTRLTRRLRGKLHTTREQIEPGHHIFRAYWKNSFL